MKRVIYNVAYCVVHASTCEILTESSCLQRILRRRAHFEGYCNNQYSSLVHSMKAWSFSVPTNAPKKVGIPPLIFLWVFILALCADDMKMSWQSEALLLLTNKKRTYEARYTDHPHVRKKCTGVHSAWNKGSHLGERYTNMKTCVLLRPIFGDKDNSDVVQLEARANFSQPLANSCFLSSNAI